MRIFRFRHITVLCLASLVLSFCGECLAADLITLTPSSGIITKGQVSFKIAAQALVPPTASPAAFAGVVLLTGGDGVLGLDAQGRITEQGGNFLIRSAYRFLNAGMNVAISMRAAASPTVTVFLWDTRCMSHRRLRRPASAGARREPEAAFGWSARATVRSQPST